MFRSWSYYSGGKGYHFVQKNVSNSLAARHWYTVATMENAISAEALAEILNECGGWQQDMITWEKS